MDSPFVLVVLLSDHHPVSGGLVHVVVRVYPHFVRNVAETFQASVEKTRIAMSNPAEGQSITIISFFQRAWRFDGRN